MRRGLRNVFRTGLVLAMLLPLAGCWSAVELNNRVFVSTLIIDRSDEGIELTIGFPLPAQLIPGDTGGTGGGSMQPSAFISRTGISMEEALQKIQGDLSRNLSFGQTQSVILGTDYARHGIEHIIEFIARHPYLKLNTNLFIVEGNAKEKVAQSPVLIERFLMSVLTGYIRNNQVLSTTVRDLMNLQANGGDRIIPVLSFKQNYTLSMEEQHPSVGTGGSAIIRKGKLVGPLLTPEETSTARSILAQLRQYIFSIPSPGDGEKIGVYTNSLNTKIYPVRHRDGITMMVHCMADAGIIASDSSIDLSKEENLDKIREAIEELARTSIEELIAKTQKMEADVFNFAQHIEVKYPRDWQQIKPIWREYYKDRLKVTVTAQFDLKRAGSSSQSFRNKFINPTEPTWR